MNNLSFHISTEDTGFLIRKPSSKKLVVPKKTMAVVSPHLSIIILNRNGLSYQIKIYTVIYTDF